MEYLHTVGNLLKDPMGRTVFLRGCQRYGMSEPNYATIGAYYLVEQSFIDMKTMLNPRVVRVDLAMKLAFPTLDFTAPDPTYFAFLDNIVAWCGNRGIYVVLDLHGWDLSLTWPSDFWVGGSNDHLGIKPEYRDAITNFWIYIAQRYIGNPTVVGIDFLNEPWDVAPQVDRPFPDEWRAECINWIDAVRSVNPKLLFFVENARHQIGGHFGWDWVRTNPINRSNVVYSPHMYFQGGYDNWRGLGWYDVPGNTFPQEYDTKDYIQAKANLREFITSTLPLNQPLFIGEFGAHYDEEGLTYLSDFLEIMNEFGLSYAYWTWLSRAGNTSYLIMNDWTTLSPTGIVLGEYIDKTPTPPSPLKWLLLLIPISGLIYMIIKD